MTDEIPTQAAFMERRDQTVARHVTSKVNRLLGQLQRGDGSAGRAALARLRSCDLEGAGADPAVWEVTLGGLPRGATPDADRVEAAAHAALVLFALHQRSQERPMHETQVGFGDAIRELARARAQDEDLDSGVVKRLHQVALANDQSARMNHLRGLIALLRDEEIAMDYGRLARDLYWLSDARYRDRVLLSWGRALHSRTIHSDKEPTE